MYNNTVDIINEINCVFCSDNKVTPTCKYNDI